MHLPTVESLMLAAHTHRSQVKILSFLNIIQYVRKQEKKMKKKYMNDRHPFTHRFCSLGKNKNFKSYSPSDVDTLSEPYDFKSILHYDNKAFSKNGHDTIQALKNPNLRFGDAKRLSPGNVREIRKLYKCDRRKAKLNGNSFFS